MHEERVYVREKNSTIHCACGHKALVCLIFESCLADDDLRKERLHRNSVGWRKNAVVPECLSSCSFPSETPVIMCDTVKLSGVTECVCDR